MTTIQFSDSARSVRGWLQSEDFTVSLVDATVPFGTESSIQQAFNDITYDGHTTSGALQKSDLVVTNNLDNPPVSFSSKTPDVCSIDAEGRVSWVSNGLCRVGVRGQCGERVISQITGTIGVYTFYDSIAGYAPGSLRAYMAEQQLAALDGVAPGAAAQRAGLYPNGWAAGLASAVQMSGSYGGVNPNNFLRAQGKAGFAGFNDLALLDELLDNTAGGAGWKVWLSPHHYLTWMGHDTSVPGGSNWLRVWSEITLVYSAAPSPASTVAKLLPGNFRDYIPPHGVMVHTAFPLWARMYNTYQGSGSASERRWVQPVSYSNEPLFDFTTGGDARRAYQVTRSDGTIINGGDSGTPLFTSIGGELVFVSHITAAGSAGWAHYADYIAEINAAMAYFNASGSYTVQTVDLSGFTNYA